MKKLFKFLSVLRKIFLPTKKEMNISEAKKLVKTLMVKYPIEKQSDIALMIVPELINERIIEIDKHKVKIARLEKDLELLKNHVSI